MYVERFYKEIFELNHNFEKRIYKEISVAKHNLEKNVWIKMNIEEIIQTLDNLFNIGKMDQVELFLKEQLQNAKTLGKEELALAILNEQIGFFRVTTQKDKIIETVQEMLRCIEHLKIEKTIEGGTTFLNIATAYRSIGWFEEAEEYYQKVLGIYSDCLEENDYRRASLYNNMSLLFMEQEKYESAIRNLLKAEKVMIFMPEKQIPLAVTYTNLGQAYCYLQQWENAKKYLDQADMIFARTEYKDEHYSGLGTALGYYFYQLQDYQSAVVAYEKALLNVYESYGRTKNYYQIQTALQEAYEKNGNPKFESMLEVCEAYYETYGKAMIHEKFADYEDKIAVGLCGEGSECLGLEDEISLDHDCGPGFAMWLPEEVFRQIGKPLQEEYEKLPKVFAGYVRIETQMGNGRCGVCTIQGFYERVLGEKIESDIQSENVFQIQEEYLLTATNGKVFADPLGDFSAIRNRIKAYYPRKLWLEKLARELMYAAQYGQYNYGRAMARKDYVAANIALAKYMQSIMQVVYLLNKKYCPYYKWQKQMMNSLEILPEVGNIMEAICDMPSQRNAWENFIYTGKTNPEDMIAQTIEIVAALVVNELQQMGLSASSDAYLEEQAREVLKHI